MKKISIILLVLLTAGIPIVFARSSETLKKEIPLKDEQALKVNIELGLATLEIIPGDGKNLMTADIQYDPDKIDPVISYSPGKTGILEIKSEKIHDFDFNKLKKLDNMWNIALTDRIPIDMNIDLGLGEGVVDLTGLRLTDVNLDAGLSSLDISFTKPNKSKIARFRVDSGLGEFKAEGLLNANMERFVFSGGLGSSELYFTGDCSGNIDASIEVGLGSVNIVLKEDLPVKIRYEKSFLSSLDLNGFKKIDDSTYVSRNWNENAKCKLLIDIEVGLGSVEIDWE